VIEMFQKSSTVLSMRFLHRLPKPSLLQFKPTLLRSNFHTNFHLKDKYNSSSSNSELSPKDSDVTSARLDHEHVANRRLLISFTCKVCLHRSTKTMSKHAYERGVVLIQCPSCLNRHLIADHLGFFRDGRTTIEDLMLEQGEKVTKLVDLDGSQVLECYQRVMQEERNSEQIKKASSECKE
ncbi:4948_t:CDS:1, partial [Acaulospora colombiana]